MRKSRWRKKKQQKKLEEEAEEEERGREKEDKAGKSLGSFRSLDLSFFFFFVFFFSRAAPTAHGFQARG